jgi:hypothetical protein
MLFAPKFVGKPGQANEGTFISRATTSWYWRSVDSSVCDVARERDRVVSGSGRHGPRSNVREGLEGCVNILYARTKTCNRWIVEHRADRILPFIAPGGWARHRFLDP